MSEQNAVHLASPDTYIKCAIQTSVRPSGEVSGHLPENAWGNGMKFCMLMYLGHLQNWLDYGHHLLIFLLLAPLWLSEMGQIWGFRAFLRERMVGMAWNFACWCILTLVTLVKRVKFGVSAHFSRNTWREWPENLHADLSWPPSEQIRLGSWSVDLSNFGIILT